MDVHCREHINKPSKRSEQFILNLPHDHQRAHVAYEYAKKVLGSRFVKAECFIKNEPDMAARYARHVIKGPWTAAEKQIRSRMSSYYYYAKYVKRNMAGSEQMVQDAFKKKEGGYGASPIYYAFLYCMYVRKKRWPLFEQLLEEFYTVESPYYLFIGHAVRYAKRFRKGRWEMIEEKVLEGETSIISDYASILSPSDKEEFHNKILMDLMMMTSTESSTTYFKRGIKNYAKKTNLIVQTPVEFSPPARIN